MSTEPNAFSDPPASRPLKSTNAREPDGSCAKTTVTGTAVYAVSSSR
jgi:hypothetical protein